MLRMVRARSGATALSAEVAASGGRAARASDRLWRRRVRLVMVGDHARARGITACTEKEQNMYVKVKGLIQFSTIPMYPEKQDR